MAAHTGIGTYLRGLAGGFKNNRQPEFSRLALYQPRTPDTGTGFSQIFFNAPIYSWQEQLAYPQLLATCRLWHAPHYNIPYAKRNTKLVTTIHDIIHWKYRHTLNVIQRVYAERMLARAVQISDHIITVSQHTKNDLIEFFSADAEKVTVIYNGVSPDFYPIPAGPLEAPARALTAKYRLPESFFLYVGMLKPHKNVLRLLKNYLKLRAENKITSGMVVIGQGKKNAEEIRLMNQSAGSITYLTKIEYGELPVFYNRARALVHPSLYEGFGLTVIESMACGTPVITTRCASLPEVGGNAAYYVGGEDDKEWEAALIQFDQDETIKTRMFDAGMRQACKFSWDKAARETAQIYDKVLRLS